MNRNDLLQHQKQASDEYDKLMLQKQLQQEQLDAILESLTMLRGEHRAFGRLIAELEPHDPEAADPAAIITVNEDGESADATNDN